MKNYFTKPFPGLDRIFEEFELSINKGGKQMKSKLAGILKMKGTSQSQLARDIGVSPAFISYMVKGSRQPSVAVLKRMSEHLNVPMDELV